MADRASLGPAGGPQAADAARAKEERNNGMQFVMLVRSLMAYMDQDAFEARIAIAEAARAQQKQLRAIWKINSSKLAAAIRRGDSSEALCRLRATQAKHQTGRKFCGLIMGLVPTTVHPNDSAKAKLDEVYAMLYEALHGDGLLQAGMPLSGVLDAASAMLGDVLGGLEGRPEWADALSTAKEALQVVVDLRLRQAEVIAAITAFEPGPAVLVSQLTVPPATVGCWNCKQPASGPGVKLKKCSRCKLARYCSLKCQREHWKREHKTVCLVL